MSLTSGCIHIRNREAFYFGNYSEAEALFKKGEYDKAIQKYQAYIDENPEGNLAVISNYYIAKSHDALGHTDEAKQLYQQIVEKYPSLIWSNFSETRLKELSENPSSKVAMDLKKDDPKIAAPKAEIKDSPKKKKKRFFLF